METLNAAHDAMRAALAEQCPELDASVSEQARFGDEMRQTMAEFPEQKHDFTFVRRRTLHRVTGSDAAAAAVFEAWFQKRNSPRLFEGAREALRSLRAAGLKIGTLSDGNADPLGMEALQDLVDFHVSAAEAGAPKPDARMFALCETKASCSAPELVMVGDSAEKDVRGALDAGWRAIWVRPPAQGSVLGSAFDLTDSKAVSGESRAHATVDHVREVEGVIRSWTS
eukprot:CAMPEP_0171216208 /NCGR_PEP_ID=MMETSP0790-20130122/32062_1 /TAXON_ID=2925 /ORGANISM="Alexandrium catenella, Strain OF101" /LENGTH=225 /DNA_ID=CAMNT_0011681981 /DNA_START=25 /DNA_END=702 /DNA_ORIENTATION=-